jgi:hypothetical protein
MTLQAALMAAIGTLVTVVVTLSGAVTLLWRENREQYRARARDSGLFLNTLERLRSKYSASLPPQARRTPSDPPRADPQTLAGFYSTHGAKRSRTRP